MEVTYTAEGQTETEDGLTLAEETSSRLFLQNEDGAFDERIEGGMLESVTGCHSIGFIDFNEEEVAAIDEAYLSEPVEHSVHLAPVALAEQQGDTVHIEMEDGTAFDLTGDLDRAYTY